jgi:hypothetical protein
MDAAKAYKLCGTTEKKIERRKETESKPDEALDRAFLVVFGDIKNETEGSEEWKKISFENMKHDNRFAGFLKATHRGSIMQMLQEHKNIISRPVTKGNSKDGTIPHTIPLEFKYVEEKVKDELAEDGVCFRQVQGVNKRRIVSALYKMDPPIQSKWADIFAVADFLITRGANKAWIYTRPLEIASMTNVGIDQVIEALMELHDAKILVIRDFDKPLDGEVARIKSICRLTKNELEYRQLSTMPLDDIKTIGVEKQHRSRQKTLQKVEQALAMAKEKNLLPEKKPILDQDELAKADSLEEAMAIILKQGMEIVNEKFNTQVEKSVSEYKNKIDQKSNQLTQQSIEVADLRQENKQLKLEIEKAKEIQKKLVEFNDGAIAAAQNATFSLMGAISKIVKDFAVQAAKDRTILLDDSKINALSGRIIKEAESISDSMLQYKKDVYPPAEKA